MTATSAFLLAAALLLLVVLAILLWPLLRHGKRRDVALSADALDRREANLAIFRDQMAELDRDRAEGLLLETDFQAARNELQRRLLDEAQGDSTAARQAGGRATAFTLLAVIPLLAIAGYLLLGRPQALEPAVHGKGGMDSAQIEAMLGKLADKLRANPGDTKGWVILARSYKALGRLAEAADAYAHGGELLDSEAVLLADYADVLLRLNGGNDDGKPGELIDRALKLNPDEPMALYLAGAAAENRHDYAGVVRFWERLMPQLEAGSEDAKNIGGALDEARKMLGISGVSSANPAPASVPAQAASKGAEAIGGEVAISGKIAAQAKPDDLLFIFARAEEGSRMPLAVMRRQVADLPLSFSLDDSMGLPGGKKISEFPSVVIEARVAKAGMAKSTSGDLYGIVQGVKPGSKDVKVVIDQVQP